MDAIRTGLIGAGSAGLLHALSYSQIPGKAKLVAVCDANETTAKGIAKTYKAEKTFTDYRKMLELKDIDAVSICLPHSLHADVAEAAAKAGKHILCEKPMATTLGDCDRMIGAAKKAGVKLMIAENHRWTPAHIAMKEALDQGKIGDIILARTYEVVDERSNMSNPNLWKGTADRAGGGSLMDQGVHKAAMLRWFCGDVKSVYCWTSQQMMKLPNKAEDTAMMFLKFEKGAVGDLFLSFAPIAYYNNAFELYGTHGTILEDHSWSDPVRVYSTKPGKDSYRWVTPKVEHQPYPGYYKISFKLEAEHFVDCILQDRQPEPSGEDGKAAVEVALLGYLSAKTGKEIRRGEVSYAPLKLAG
ncbi:MAG: Gfo/Idh/MocA family oxidoreductase [Promethearchaeati archaeon SRVP18_Atabeyarchaeia-1]